jgi:hypothetical protein
MTRIVVVEPDGAGGMIHYAYQMCTALAAGGADVTLITSTSYELAALPHSFRVIPMMRLWPTIPTFRPRPALLPQRPWSTRCAGQARPIRLGMEPGDGRISPTTLTSPSSLSSVPSRRLPAQAATGRDHPRSGLP